MASRGGYRPGAGAKTKFEREQKLQKDLQSYTPTINVHKELENCFKKLKKVKTKEELTIIQAQIDVLAKLSPYVMSKKGVATEQASETNVPEMTVLSVKGTGEPKEPKEEESTKEIESEEDFVWPKR